LCSNEIENSEFAEISGNRPTARQFNAGESIIKEWRKRKELLKTMKEAKKQEGEEAYSYHILRKM